MFLTLFVSALRAAVVAKLVKQSILFVTSIFLAWRVVLVAKLVISGILSSIFLILSISNLYTSDFKLAKSVF